MHTTVQYQMLKVLLVQRITPEMNPDTINQKASQVNSAKSALNGDEN